MKSNRGVYGPDDVAWEVQDARNLSYEDAYRKNPEMFDAPVRLDAKMALLIEHEDDGQLYQDGDNVLHIGYEKNGKVRTFGVIDMQKRLIQFAPLVVSTRYLVRWAPLSKINLREFQMIAPKGCV